jgi:cell wall-associated NlpC family hydrolase
MMKTSQHVATDEQKAQLVVEPRMTKEKIKKLLTFEEIPTKEEIEARAKELARIAVSEASMYAGDTDNVIWITRVMIGGAPYLWGHSRTQSRECGFTPVYAFSKRESEEISHNLTDPSGRSRCSGTSGFVEV